MQRFANCTREQKDLLTALMEELYERALLRLLWDELHSAYATTEEPLFGTLAQQVAREGALRNDNIWKLMQSLTFLWGDGGDSDTYLPVEPGST